MRLTAIVNELDYHVIQGSLDVEVSSIAYDSREVIKDSLFVAISGFTIDGHRFVEQAIEMGAHTIIVEKEVVVPNHITVIQVADSRNALARISANFYHNPTEQLNLIGITGTNGKTSTTYFIQSIFEQAQQSIGIIGTIGTVINQQVIKNKNTTPESLNLQQTFTQDDRSPYGPLHYGGFIPCIKLAASRLLSIQHEHLHESYSRPSGAPSEYGRVLSGESATVRSNEGI